MRGRGFAALGVVGVVFAASGIAGRWWRGGSGSRELAPASAAVERPKPPPAPVRLVAVGDLMLGTNVKQVILSQGASYPFRKYRRLLGQADLAFGNLETPLSDRGTPTLGKSQESLEQRVNFIFRAPPASADGLEWAGFDVVSVANNHTMDYGPVALQDTLDALDGKEIAHVGAGADLAAAAAPVFLERKGQKFAVFGISDILPLFSAATEKTAGIAPARGAYFERVMPKAIAQARKKADWVLVSAHWGKERFTGATPKQKRLAHKLIDWGADVVIGHHTHCLGPVEQYHGGLIHYSLGNFISHTGARANIGAWEVTFTPTQRPTAESLTFRWNGDLLTASGKSSPRRHRDTESTRRGNELAANGRE